MKYCDKWHIETKTLEEDRETGGSITHFCGEEPGHLGKHICGGGKDEGCSYSWEDEK